MIDLHKIKNIRFVSIDSKQMVKGRLSAGGGRDGFQGLPLHPQWSGERHRGSVGLVSVHSSLE